MTRILEQQESEEDYDNYDNFEDYEYGSDNSDSEFTKPVKNIGNNTMLTRSHNEVDNSSDSESELLEESQKINQESDTARNLRSWLTDNLTLEEKHQKIRNENRSFINGLLQKGTMDFLESNMHSLCIDLEISAKDENNIKRSLFFWLKKKKEKLPSFPQWNDGEFMVWSRNSASPDFAKLSIIAKRVLTLVASEAGVERIISRQRKLLTHSRMNTKNTLFEVRSCAFSCASNNK